MANQHIFRLSLVLLYLALTLTACGSEDMPSDNYVVLTDYTEPASEEQQPLATMQQASVEPTGRETLCIQFPESLVRTVFPIPAGQALQNSADATCQWAWTEGVKSQGVSVNFLRSARPATLDLLYTRMRDRSTQEVRGQQVTTAPKQVEWVSGVGEKAFWNNDLSQLAVYAKQRLFYVNVNIDGMTKTQKIQSAGDAAKAIIKGL